MRTWLAIIALGLSFGLSSARAADPIAVADMKPPARWLPNKKTMDRDGRFHFTHVKKEKMDCEDCHTDASKDALFLRANEPPPATLTSHIERAECIECHQMKKKLVFYGAQPR